MVEQVRQGNEAAFEVIYDRHHRGILSFCRHMLGSRDEAEDAVQHTFTSAYTDLQSNDREIRLKAWLYTIARNRCLSMLRARREQPSELDEQPTAGLSEEVQRREDLRDLLHDLGDLPDDQREALVLFEVGDLSQAEVARVIGVEPMKVKALVFQARSALIEKREARAIPCNEIREQLATASGGELRRGPLRRHLKVCDGCSEYRDQVRAQRSALALVLPVVPTLGLKDGILSAIGFGGGAGGAGIASGGAAGGAMGGAAFGGSSAGGGIFASIAGIGGVKLAVAATLVGGGLIGGGVAIQSTVDDAAPPKAEAADGSDSGSGGAASGGAPREPGGVGVAPIGSRGERDEQGDGGKRGDDDRDDDRDGKRGDDDSRADDDERGDRRGGKRRGGKGRDGRGGDNGGSRRGGKGRRPGGREGSNSGRRGGTTQRGPRRPGGVGVPPRPGDAGSRSGSNSGRSDTDATDGTSDTRESKPPLATPDATDGVDSDAADGSHKDGGKGRFLPPVPLPE